MRKLTAFSTMILLTSTSITLLQSTPADGETKPVSANTLKSTHVLGHEMNSLAGEKIDLAKKYENRVVLIVNVASRCGLTPQYKQLQALHEKYAEQGLAVLGFPCNQFLGQEPGSSEQIQAFCKKNYGVEFDMFEKVEVNGNGACNLYKQLTKLDTKPKGAGKISWNFEKFLIGRDGQVIARFGPRTSPNDKAVISAIQAAL